MPTDFLLVCAELLFELQVKGALDPTARIDLMAADAESAAKKLADKHDDDAILILDAQIPRAANMPPDREERSALSLLSGLRGLGIRIPTLVITSRPLGISELDEFCTPENRAIALPQRQLKPAILRGFIDMLLNLSNIPKPTWDVIELDVKRTSVKCILGNRAGDTIDWAEASTRTYSAAQSLAIAYARPNFSIGWARQIHNDGSLLFQELVFSTLGPGLFFHLERAAGGLGNLAFRFRIEDSTLYCAPFEATVRVSGHPTGTDDDFTQSPFVLVNAPITRRMKVVSLRTAAQKTKEIRAARMLFIRSQVGENPSGSTTSDTVGVPERDQTGAIRMKHVEFRRLENVDRELDDLRALQASSSAIFSLDELDLSTERDGVGAEVALKRKLMSSAYDVIHFAGHSLTTKDGLTLLVLPGALPGEAECMPVYSFAEAAAAAGARLVYLSSCQGSSANTVANLAQRSIPHVLGFRCDVDDERAAIFAKYFYSDLFGPGSRTICEAFRAACRGVYEPMQVEASPIWASPILASHSDDWMAQRVL